MSASYELSFAERSIVMLALAGFKLDEDELAVIRPLYMRIFRDGSDAIGDKPPVGNLMLQRPAANGPRPPDVAQQVVLNQIIAERRRQDSQWGGAGHDDEHGPSDWLGFLKEHRDRAAKTVKDSDAYRHRLVVIAALAVAAIESHDRGRK